MEFQTKTARIDIGTQTIYPIVGRDNNGKLAFIQITIGHRDKGDDKSREQIDDDKSMIEVICRQAIELMRLGMSEEVLLEFWRATRFNPAGVCPQLNCTVTSPLDAIARWLQRGMNPKG